MNISSWLETKSGRKFRMESIESLASRLQAANYAYHNTDKTLMTDDEYDKGLEELRRRCPTHPFLSVIGATASKDTVLLPYTMASLDKVRYSEGGLGRWMKRNPHDYVITEKLDGLSALYVCSSTSKPKRKMYLRGDGVRGVDVSFATEILTLPSIQCVVRGEILLSNEKTPEGSIGRSLVNGWLHRKAKAELSQCDFVAYQVLEPKGMSRQEQMRWLEINGFCLPSIEILKAKELTEEKAKQLLVAWRSTSKYPLDGIVIGTNTIPLTPAGGEAKNPDDAVAFKAALDEQRATTNVIAVEWNLSRQGIWVPRIQIEPVVIGGARIQWLSGHNAAAIAEGVIGPRAKIVIRRSGDVIPTLETVLEPAPEGAAMPEEGTWEWDERHVQAIAVGDIEAPEKAIQHCLSVLGVEGIGPGLVKKMVDEGLDTMAKVYGAKEDILSELLGPGRGPVFKEALCNTVASANQVTLLLASNKLPRGVAEKKLRTLYSIEANAKFWPDVFEKKGMPTGWSEETLGTLFKSLPKAFAWIEQSFGKEAKGGSSSNAAPVSLPSGDVKYVVFTGVRDKELQSRMGEKGYVLQDSVNKQTNILVIADDAEGGPETVKTKKAKQLGVEILTLSKFRSRC